MQRLVLVPFLPSDLIKENYGRNIGKPISVLCPKHFDSSAKIVECWSHLRSPKKKVPRRAELASLKSLMLPLEHSESSQWLLRMNRMRRMSFKRRIYVP